MNEHCLDTTQPKILKDLYDAGKATNKYGTQIFGSSSETFPNAYKPGGTMVGITGHLSGRIEEKSIDSKGRWTWAQLTGKKGKKVLVISAYRVSQTYAGEAGYSTAFMQQYRALIKDNVSKPKPKQRCLLDLTKAIQDWKQKFDDNSTILTLDANWDESDAHFRTFLRDTWLQDVVGHMSPELKGQGTYI